MPMPNDGIEKTRDLEGIGELSVSVHGLEKTFVILECGERRWEG
jgi:hypothetical protein